jgi:hypothetical protein
MAAALVFSASPTWADSFSFVTALQPDGRMAAATRPESGSLIEIEAGDDFITTAEQTTLTNATFIGLLPGTTTVSNIEEVVVEIYRVFPLDSQNPANGKVPTRTNSPSDVAFDVRDSDSSSPDEKLTFVATALGNFMAANSVLNGINPSPNQTTGGEGAVSGTQVRIDVTFTSPFRLPPGHYFFVPQVKLDGDATFYWLSAPGNNPPLFQGDLQAWIRNANLDPNWLRIGTDIVDGSAPIPTFNMAFSLTGTTEAASLRAAILPSSRSVQVGTTATAFATVINPTASAVNGVRVSLNTPLPANFSFQPTDPTTNVPIGSPGDSVDIPPGGKQTFVIALTPVAPIDPTDVSFAFSGGNAPVISGVDTLLFSASVTAVPDIIALAATINNDGIVNVPGPNGNGVFAVATINLGADAAITATADTGTAQLPVTIFLCQTNPANSRCLNPQAPTTNPVTADISTGGTATFGIFVAGSGTVAFDPATNRIFVRFKDANGVVHGTTSVAVRTQ